MKWNPELYKTKHAFVFDLGESLIQLLNPQNGERVLDLGCGTGELTQQISKVTEDIIGVDKSSEMIERAALEYPNINFQVGDASNFQFEKKFDAIFSNATLHWVLQYREAAKCMFDNLVAGGRIVIEFGGRGYTQEAEIEPWYFPSIGEYCSELEAVGFRVTRAEHYDRPTKLKDSESGIVDWIKMFGKVFFAKVSNKDVEEISQEVQDELKDKMFIDNNWYADYKRIRIVAFK